MIPIRSGLIIVALFFINYGFAQKIPVARSIISLNGIWEIAEGDSTHIPGNFTHKVQVPGLADMSQPGFKEVGPKVKNRREINQHDSLRESFWYRKSFEVKGSVPEVAILKISKAKYGTKVFLNGREMGLHMPGFTPGYFDIKGALKRGKNELIVRVGASRDALPRSVPDGFDFEKERYIPGIYDNVSIILSGQPRIIRVQTAPDIVNEELQVQVTLDTLERLSTVDMRFIVREKKSGKIISTLSNAQTEVTKTGMVNVRIAMKGSRLWSPEDPFLYNLEVKTKGDMEEVNFGMRDFHFDQMTKRPMLNGKPYMVLGTNVTVYRFFEDPDRDNLPWDTVWVRNLMRSFKQFHWNSIRLCIGLPPEIWYEVADEEGFLLQNEFPVWYGGSGRTWPVELKADELAREYTEMMQQDWNHPSVVIWDASNENVAGLNDETGKAVWRVRNLDLSNRPWDNSYEKHRAPGDVYEVHPYHFFNPDFKLKDILNSSIVPQQGGHVLPNLENFPVIINEYGWLWLNRDGTPTPLTDKVYTNLLGFNSTTEERWHLYATYMAAETEFWRVHRKAAGILIFTALGYSRPDGQTSDFFTDVKRLKYADEILKYLPDAFSPVGIMLDEWGAEIRTGSRHGFKIMMVNDLGSDWKGRIELRILKNNEVIKTESMSGEIPAYGESSYIMITNIPADEGKYTVEAVLVNENGRDIKSVRDLTFTK